MAEKATIARPYARAAFGFAQQHGALPQWSALLGAAAAVVADPRVGALLGSPHVGSDQLVALLVEAAGPAADEHGRNFLQTLASNRRLGLLPEITAQYEELRAEAEGVVDVELVAAMPVAPAQEQRLVAALERRLKRQVRVHTRIDASLVGGAIVRAGDLVVDGSLKGRLARLAATMTA
ncbi:MAG: F0F1 ATP synthase subunit delta [Steroidobacteraceae bacterium]|jgi:F-type H+-transporting ATPase subunit delta|nr:F0F1 ATP synthase subunit delta [Steroidobacteraceae bacterium]